MKIVVLFLLLLTMLSGCNRQSSNPTFSKTEIAPSNQPGWLVYTNRTEGLRMILPSSWKQVSLEPDKIDASMKDVSKDPSTVQSLTSYVHSRAAAGVGFLAIDSGGAAILQLSWKHFDKNSPINLDSLAETWTLNAGLGAEQLIGSASHTRLNFPIGEAQVVKYTTTESASTQFLVGHDNDIYIIAFSVNPANASRYDSVISRIGNSLQSMRERTE